MLSFENEVYAKNLPEGLMERCSVTSHDFRSAWSTPSANAALIKDLMQDSLLLEPIDVVWSLGSDH